MDSIFLTYQTEISFTAGLIIFMLFLRLALKTAAKKVGKREDINIGRINLMFKYINVLVVFIAAFLLLLIWGVEASRLALVFSSVFAVLGVGLFAIWSILSNITSGVILFFSFPYKIGDKIQIHDKDFPIEAIIEDIRAFQLHLRTADGELITYPNNLILQKPVSLKKKNPLNDDGADAV
ncbi:mechanosensitive ion channel domain-containing protein [Haloflavibacter putidus]|uniref:Mechanosensitive ion channel n=1 Tax=Haloflavibacter putidus TaxID=2576776 RepID=A0A507ZU13_9FLAO|nr:mechanosensitive ion channel domain-containing protein [Haloflavibacter putidus]TQD40081.1 mechanosensitive ion channel [Haloflavibacter putidus]